MKATQVLSPEAMQHYERDHEAFYMFVVPEIENMDESTQLLLFPLLQKSFDLCSTGNEDNYREGNRIREDVDLFVHGWRRQLPRNWRLILAECVRRDDPDYVEYQRLKKKFGGA